MIRVLPSAEDERLAREYTKESREWFGRMGITNNRAYTGQGDALNYRGILAEFMVARYFNAKHNNRQAFDNGIDLILMDGRTVDVKSIRKGAFYLIEFPEKVEKKGNELYILTEWRDNELIILGWVNREDYIKRAKTYNFGYGERLVMHKNDLNKYFDGFT